jgi:Domain of unknown function (DUF4112)
MTNASTYSAYTGRALTREEDVARTLERLRALANTMDSLVRVPGTNVTLGLDAALGLVPVVGDLVAQAIGGYIVYEARRLGVRKRTLLRMGWNMVVDTAMGSVPLVGDVFDVVWKANRKNLALLERHLERELAKNVIEGQWQRVG